MRSPFLFCHVEQMHRNTLYSNIIPGRTDKDLDFILIAGTVTFKGSNQFKRISAKPALCIPDKHSSIEFKPKRTKTPSKSRSGGLFNAIPNGDCPVPYPQRFRLLMDVIK